MGLFSFGRKKDEKTPAKNNALHEQLIKEELELQERIKKQDEFIRRKNNIEQRYKETGNIDEYIVSYRKELENEIAIELAGGWFFRYVENLIDAKKYNEAWAQLNHITMYHLDGSTGRISDLRYRILKEEDRLPVDAIYHMMVATLFRFNGVKCDKKPLLEQEKKTFLRKAKPLAKKAGFNTAELEYLYHLIECEAVKNKITTSKLESAYSKFLAERTG